ncbi:MAG: hypothetical protein J7M26_01910 [Armatimonadetes bacterium]|nr:hypothetical protein [Armatimonadota bacterium]
MSVYDIDSFLNPPNRFRPLQIVHGLDRSLEDPENLTGEAGIDRRLDKLVEMGTGGIVANVGFIDYLVSPRQWEIYRYGIEQAAKRGLVLWWYDEKGYPSGTAGGMVTRANPEYVALGLACYRLDVEGPAPVRMDLPASCRRVIWAGAMADPDTATTADVTDLTNLVDAWDTLRWDAPAGHWAVLLLAERVMYEGTHSSSNVCELKHYVNLLNPDAVRAFLRLTHEQYYRETPKELWDQTVAVFTDEPSFMTTYVHKLPDRFEGKIPVIDAPIFADRPPAVPWVEGLLDSFRGIKGYDLRPHLFQLFYSGAGEAQYARQAYYQVVTELYTEAFYRQVLRWCQEHGIASSGHVMAEETLLSHVAYHGSLFSVIREMDLPGIDMLNADPQDMLAGQSFMTPKQVSSVAHLTGAKQIHSESSDWVQGNAGRHATLAERRGQGNLQYVLGVNQITSYYGWSELGEEAWRQYNDYMGRLASLLTGGRHVCDVAVLYAIRSMWAHYLPALEPPVGGWETRQPHRDPYMGELNEAYPNLVRTLLCAQVDLDIVDERALIEGAKQDGALRVADEAYRVLILPDACALSLAAGRALAAFCRAGGVALAVGRIPSLAEGPEETMALREEMDALVAEGWLMLIPADELVTSVRRAVDADMFLAEPSSDALYTHRVLEGRHLYFIINNSPDPTTLRPTLRVPGPYDVYCPLTGDLSAADEPLELDIGGYEGVFVVAGGRA